MIQAYFNSEKKGAYLALALGLIACTFGSGLLISAKPPFYTGLAIPLIVIGIIQIFTGASIARNSDFQAYDLDKLLSDNRIAFIQAELPRMENALKTLQQHRYIEMALVAIGFILILVVSEPVFSKGLGAGMFAQGAVSFLLDYFSEKRGKSYLQFIRSFAQ